VDSRGLGPYPAPRIVTENRVSAACAVARRKATISNQTDTNPKEANRPTSLFARIPETARAMVCVRAQPQSSRRRFLSTRRTAAKTELQDTTPKPESWFQESPRNLTAGVQNMWLELTRRTNLRSHSKTALSRVLRFALHHAGAQLNHVVMHASGEIAGSAPGPLPSPRACCFAADPAALHIGSGLKTVTDNRD